MNKLKELIRVSEKAIEFKRIIKGKGKDPRTVYVLDNGDARYVYIA